MSTLSVFIKNFMIYADLQMAATFGKMLLEKNEQLELDLRNLQKVAEETTLENQVTHTHTHLHSVCYISMVLHIVSEQTASDLQGECVPVCSTVW